MARIMSKRPIRNTFENTLERIPRGPLGFIGDGNFFGAGTYFIVALINGLIPIDGVEIGFRVRSHNIERLNGKERHTFEIDAYNEDVAEFISKFQSPPSNVDFITKETEVINVELVEERRTSSTWRITVMLTNREEIEQELGL